MYIELFKLSFFVYFINLSFFGLFFNLNCQKPWYSDVHIIILNLFTNWQIVSCYFIFLISIARELHFYCFFKKVSFWITDLSVLNVCYSIDYFPYIYDFVPSNICEINLLFLVCGFEVGVLIIDFNLISFLICNLNS